MVSHAQSNDLMRSPGDWQPVVPMHGVVLVTSPNPCGVHVADCTRQVVDLHLHCSICTWHGLKIGCTGGWTVPACTCADE